MYILKDVFAMILFRQISIMNRGNSLALKLVLSKNNIVRFLLAISVHNIDFHFHKDSATEHLQTSNVSLQTLSLYNFNFTQNFHQ